MECVIVSPSKTIGINDSSNELMDKDYIWSIMPGFGRWYGILPASSVGRLDPRSSVGGIQFESILGYACYLVDSEFVLYETWGHNCLIAPKECRDLEISDLLEFLESDETRSSAEVARLLAEYSILIRSFYDGGAFHLFTDDHTADWVLSQFEAVCNSRTGAFLDVEVFDSKKKDSSKG